MLGTVILLNKKIDILSFSESWLNDNKKKLYTIEGYYAFSYVRCDGRRGGGLPVYFSDVFKSKVIYPCTISIPTIETLFIETVKEINCRLLIMSISRPPSANAILFIDKLSELLSIIFGNGYDEIILCGDFNLDILNYDNNENTLNLLNSLASQSLIPIITKPSRITNQTATLIDNIFINQPNGIVSGILLSDHLPLFFLKRSLCTKKILSTKHKCEISSNQLLDHY